MKNPTLKDKVKMYEEFIHKINMACIVGDNLMLQELIANADNYSYSFRQGNGMLSEKKQQGLINDKFFKLCDTPKADASREDMKAKRAVVLDKLTEQAQTLQMGY
jgi:hypothetical protein